MRIVLSVFLFVHSITLSFCQERKPNVGFYAELIRRANVITAGQSGAFSSRVKAENKLGAALGASVYIQVPGIVTFRMSPGLSLEFDRVNLQAVFMSYDPDDPFFAVFSEQVKFATLFAKFPIHVLIPVNPSKTLTVVGGCSPHYALLGGKSGSDTHDLKLRKPDLTVDAGLAYTMKLGTVALRPELKYSLSLIDAKASGDGQYDYFIKELYRNKFSLGVYIGRL